MNSPLKNEPRHRISLTRSDIILLIESIHESKNPLAADNINMLSKLNVFLSKIDNKVIAASYMPAPPAPSLLESIGVVDTSANISIKADKKSKEQVWEDCYNKYLSNPTACNAMELECAQEHKYLNELMSQEEIATFEADQFTKYNQ